MSRNRVLCITAAIWLITATALALEVPSLLGRVNDYADLLSSPAESTIAAKLEALERDTGAQVAVLTIDTLGGDPLDEFALRVVESWKLGRADQDDGALLLVVKNDRKTRLEVGYGLEPTVTDIMSKRILDQVLRPRFRAGDFDGGIEAAVDAIDGLIRGTSTLPPPDSNTFDGQMPPRFFGVLWLLFLIPFVLVVVGTNPFQWFLYLFLVPFVFVGGMTALHPNAGPLFVVAWLVSAPIIWSFIGRRRKKQTRRRRGGRSGWAGGAWSSGGGWSSSGGSSGGGFSGGGGSFGGGGASSSW